MEAKILSGIKSSGIGKKLSLPDPYGQGFEHAEDPLEHTKQQWEKLEQRRLIIGRLSRKPSLMWWRSLNGFFLSLFAFISLLEPSLIESTGGWIFFLLIPVVVAVAPSVIAGEAAWQAMQARISLREQGGVEAGKHHALRAQPGMDRILESLRDQRRNNLMASVLSGVTFALLILASAFESDSLAWNLALLVAMTGGVAQTFHSVFSYDFVRQQGDPFPSLVFHAPTHHPTQLGSVLGDLLVAHLDPDLSLEWDAWRLQFKKSLIPGHISKQALERLLYILHLHMEGEISADMALEELRAFLLPDRIEKLLLGEENRFNWRNLQRLIAHARGWQPGAFLLLDRLQYDLLSGAPPLLRAEWRMDVALDETCYAGSGNLFIALNNQTFKERHVRVEVLTPNGEPESRDHRFELSPCPPPRQAVNLSHPSEDDALDWIPRYLERGVVLWISVAWPKEFTGPADVQVILRSDDGIVLESQVVRTQIIRSGGSQSKIRTRNLEQARRKGELPLPKFSV